MPGNTSLLSQYRSWPLAIVLLLLLIFTLSACGTNSSTTGGISSTPTSASTPTPTASQSNLTGCPDKTTVTTTPSTRASLVLKGSNSNKSVDVKKGDVIEIDLAFGQNWDGPNNVSKALLTEQASGYADTTTKMCVWRFLAIGTGTAHIDFIARPLCKKGEVCPQYIQAVSFILNIK